MKRIFKNLVKGVESKLIYLQNTLKLKNGDIIYVVSKNERIPIQVLFSTRETIICIALKVINEIDLSKIEIEVPLDYNEVENKFAVDFNLSGEILDWELNGVERKKINLEYLSRERRILNRVMREAPKERLLLGVAGVDLFNTLGEGQKIAIFARDNINILNSILDIMKSFLNENENNYIVLAGIGLTTEEKFYLKEVIENLRSKKRAYFGVTEIHEKREYQAIGLQNILRLAEGLSEKNKRVLLFIYDITNLFYILQSFAILRKEVLGKQNSRVTLYSELASIYELSGKIKGQRGSLTIIAAMTNPGGLEDHVLIDSTGYITEGQLVFSKKFYEEGVEFPLVVEDSLSRLMKDVIGEATTFKYHQKIVDEIVYQYTQAKKYLALAELFGNEELSSEELNYLYFLERVKKFMGERGNLKELKRKAISLLEILRKENYRIVTKEELDFEKSLK